MADNEHELVVIECSDPNLIDPDKTETSSEIFISMEDLSSLDLSTILNHRIIKVKISRSMLVHESSYFRSLLSGNFSESSMCCFPVKWSCKMFIHTLMFMHGYRLEVTFCNFLSLYHTALYFGLERLILVCKNWMSNSFEGRISSSEPEIEDLVLIWDFGHEHAIDWIVEPCTSYVARNFMWAMSCDTFVRLPYNFLFSCVMHPHLTVDSERHLCEALVAWISTNMGGQEQMNFTEHDSSSISNQKNIVKEDKVLEEMRTFLLPLWFILGKRKSYYFSRFAERGIATTFCLLERTLKDSQYMVGGRDQRIRLTQYSKRLDLSGCPQITAATLVLSLLSQTSYVDGLLLADIQHASINLEYPKWLSDLPMLSFEMMIEIDISKCSQLHLGATIQCFQKSFPMLKTIRMTHFLKFETRKLYQLIEKCSSVNEVDLTVDVNPLSCVNVSVLYSGYVPRPSWKFSSYGTRKTLSNITKLTLEGRTDFSDPELYDIAELCASLCYVNIRGCSQVTDSGISKFILRCRRLHSIVADDTSFGECSISAFCSGFLKTEPSNKSNLESVYLQMLHIGGCKGVSAVSLVEILSQELLLKSLCLRDTCLDDHALMFFLGSSLEMLDVSNTMISAASLSHVVVNNPGLKHLEAKGCRNLSILDENRDSLCGEMFSMLGKACKLETLSIGWGYSFSSLNLMSPSIRTLKSINVGLGGSLTPEGLMLLCSLTTSLEYVTLVFQVISDAAIMKLLETQRNLQALSFIYCMGDIFPFSLKHSVPSLKKLKLERATPWMTNDDLTQMTQNFPNITELSLVGCTHLDENSQQIICSGWPGLISLRVEDCGSVTANGIPSLFKCKAMEELLLCHNGSGLRRNIILDAASQLPMLRSISLDWCDASEGDFDLPDFANRYSLSNVKISRCKLQKCTLDIGIMEALERPVHKETLLLVWNSNDLQRTVVRERIT